MFATTLGLLYGELNRRIGYRNARNAIEAGDGNEVYEQITDLLEDYNEKYEFMESIEDHALDPGIMDTPQRAMVYTGMSSPSRTGRFMGQRKAVMDSELDLNDLREMKTRDIVDHLEGQDTGSVSMKEGYNTENSAEA